MKSILILATALFFYATNAKAQKTTENLKPGEKCYYCFYRWCFFCVDDDFAPAAQKIKDSVGEVTNVKQLDKGLEVTFSKLDGKSFEILIDASNNKITNNGTVIYIKPQLYKPINGSYTFLFQE